MNENRKNECCAVCEQKQSWQQRLKQFLRKCYICLCMAQKRHPKLVLLWCFCIPAFIMTLIHAIIGVWPFGEMSVLTLDLNAQYVFFFEALRSWIYGDGSILYSFSRSLGGEFLGIYAYYLASPLSYIVALFPKEHITEALYFIFVLKCGLCGLTFGMLVRTKDKLKPFWTVVFSTTYALIAYGTIMQHNTMWFDCMILLPLIVLGLFSLIRAKKYKLYTISLAVATLSSFYIGYMTCIFVGVFYFFAYFSMEKDERNPRGQKLHFIRTTAVVVAFSLIAVAIACLIIIPAYYGLTFGKTEFTNPNFSLNSRFDLLDLFGRLLACSYGTVRPDGLPIIYCGLLPLILIPVFFTSKKIRTREKLAYIFMSFFVVFSFSIDIIDKIWHGFQAPNWLNYRYSFVFSFLVVYMASRAAAHLKSASKKVISVGAVFLILLTLLSQVYKVQDVFDFPTVYVSILLFVVYAGTLIWRYGLRGRDIRSFRSFLLVLVCIELGGNSLYNLCYLWDDVGMSNRESYAGYLAEWRPIIDEVKAQDSGFYRMEKLPYRRMNDPSAFGFRGVTASTSTLNYKVIAFLEYMGISADSHWSEYCGSSPVTDSVLSIKYVIEYADKKRVSDVYELVANDGMHHIYKNPYYLPIAFCVSSDINNVSFLPDKSEGEDGKTHIDDVHSVFERMNHLLMYMIGSDAPVEVYLPVDYSLVSSNAYTSTGSEYTTYRQQDGSQPATITFTVSASEGREVYIHFPTQYMIEGAELKILNDFDEEIADYSTSWFNNSHYGTEFLGEVTDSKKVQLSVSGKDAIYLIKKDLVDSYFYSLDEELFKNTMSSLQSGGIVLEEYSESYFKGHINVTEDKQTVLTTIPYDAGWKVKVDGKEIETYETLDALMAFDCEAGVHQIEMNYMPDCYKYALFISIGGVAALTAVIGAEYIIRTIKKKKDTTIEG